MPSAALGRRWQGRTPPGRPPHREGEKGAVMASSERRERRHGCLGRSVREREEDARLRGEDWDGGDWEE